MTESIIPAEITYFDKKNPAGSIQPPEGVSLD